MSSSKHAIIGTAITSAFTLLLTYLSSINFGCEAFNTQWLSNGFLVAVFGGIFASAFVVVPCQIQEYKMCKVLAEQTLYNSALHLFSQVIIMQNTLMQRFKHPNENVDHNALTAATQKSFGHIQNIVVCDYNPFLVRKSKLLKSLTDFRNEEKQIYEILDECRFYYNIAINNSMIKHIKNRETPNVSGNDELIEKISKVLISRLETLKNFCDSLLTGIDYKGKYQWNIKKQNIDAESIDAVRSLNLEEYLEKYKNIWNE